MKTHAPQCNVEKWFRNPEYLGVRECNCDGYHTFDELYDHRITLFVALCKQIQDNMAKIPQYELWRSHRHSDGSMFPGQFIVGIAKQPGQQISYHLPLERWYETNFIQEIDEAPEWDGHTPTDVLVRLQQL